MANTLQKSIVDALKGLPKADARAFAKQVAQLHQAGLKKISVQSKGIPVPIDVRVTGIVDRKELEKLLPHIITKLPAGGVQVFPYGIPAAELYGVTLELK